jgi:fatty acid desaturase
MWNITHNIVHHTYTNIHGHDEDLEVAPGLIRLDDKDKLSGFQRFQHYYAFPLYGLASLSWVLRKDYVKFFQKQIGSYDTSSHPRREYFNLFFFKALYYTLFIVVPLVVLDITWWQFLIGFVAMHLAEGLVLGLVFQLAHVVEGPGFPEPDPHGNIEEAWAIHQMHTTANFASGKPLATFLCGGLNMQVEHHLFPKICHIHYPAISNIVRQTAAEFNLPYYEQPTFLTALRSHYRVLRNTARKPTSNSTARHHTVSSLEKETADGRKGDRRRIGKGLGTAPVPCSNGQGGKEKNSISELHILRLQSYSPFITNKRTISADGPFVLYQYRCKCHRIKSILPVSLLARHPPVALPFSFPPSPSRSITPASFPILPSPFLRSPVLLLIRFGFLQVRFPVFGDEAGEVAEEHDEGGLVGLLGQAHVGFLGRKVALLGVAPLAGRHQVVPARLAAARLGHHVVKGQFFGGLAILAPVAVAAEDVVAAQHHPLVGQVYVPVQPDDGRKRVRGRDRPEKIRFGA